MDRSPTLTPEPSGDVPRRTSSAILLWVTVVVTCIWMSLTMCVCGHTSWVSSIGIVPAFGYGFYMFLAVQRNNRLEQILAAVAFALIAGMLLKNGADMLFLGHAPLLR